MGNHVAPFARWQSTGTPTSGLTTWRALVYGVSTGLVIGGSLVYANYNPSFRNKADMYVPGFARIADFAADRLVDISGTVKLSSTDRVELKNDLGSQSSNHKNNTKKRTPSVVDEKPQAKEDYSVKTSDKDESMLRQAIGATSHETGVQPPSLSTQEFIDTTTKYATGPADRDSAQQSMKEDKKIATESQQGMHTEIAVKSPALVDSNVSVEPGASVKGTAASVKEATTNDVIEIQSQEPLSAQESEEHFQWLKDAAQADLLLQKVYDKFKELDKKTCDMQKVLIQSEKHRQDKYAQAMRINTGDEASVQAIAWDVSEADEAVLSAKKNITLSQFETSEVGQKLAYLLDRASDLGLKSKVDEIRQELSQLHTRAMMGTVDYADTVSGSVMEEHEDEMEKVKEWINCELGTALPQADSQQKAIILMLKKRVDVLLQKFEEAENDHQGHIADALLKQKDELEQLTEKKLQLHLQEQEQKIWREAQKKLNKATHEKEEELKEQLLMQAAAHRQHLLDALQAQAEQLGAKRAYQTEAKLTQQETHYQNELVKALARLGGVKSMVDTIVSADERTQQQQSLRTACDTLSGSLEQADLITDPNGHYSYMKETVSLQEAAHDDSFILAALDSIPQEAVNNERGIQSEAGLQQRFKKVKRVCKQVALIPETGGGLGTYALSYLHYMLTFNHVDSEKYPVDMDTFELLQVADVLLEQGNIEGAIRLVNYLKGEPKRVAQDWLRDAQLYLETKQAVYIVQNYIASTSLSIIH